MESVYSTEKLTSKVTIKQIWPRFRTLFGQYEFVQISTKIVLSVNNGVFS